MRSRRTLVPLLALAGFALSSPSARAAPREAEHAVGVRAGYVHLAVLDEAATSLSYGGHLVTGGLVYTGEARRLRWALRAGTAFGHEEASRHRGRAIRFHEQDLDGSESVIVVPIRATIHWPSAELSLEGRADLARRVSLVVGGAVRFEVAYVQGFTTPGLLQLLSLRPSIGLRLRPGARHAIELAARTTALGWITRMPYHQTVSLPGASPYEGLVRQGSHVRSLNALQTLELEGTHALHFRAHGEVDTSLGVELLHDTSPRPLRTVALRAALTALYRF